MSDCMDPRVEQFKLEQKVFSINFLKVFCSHSINPVDRQAE